MMTEMTDQAMLIDAAADAARAVVAGRMMTRSPSDHADLSYLWGA
jgi:hypothetical protein